MVYFPKDFSIPPRLLELLKARCRLANITVAEKFGWVFISIFNVFYFFNLKEAHVKVYSLLLVPKSH